jgi:hypothetical protein
MNTNKNKFIRNLPFEKRLEIIKDLKEKYPDRIPLMIIDENKKNKPLKLLVPSDITIMNVLLIIRKRVQISQEEGIYLFANIYKNQNDTKVKESLLCNSSETISYVYNNCKDDDGMLYMTYYKENVFG